MKVAIVGDVHLTLRKHKEFEEQRFKLLIDELIAAKPNIVVFAGDLLDTASPSIQELGLMYKALSDLELNGIKVKIIDGNHEALTTTKSLYDYIMPNSKIYVQDGYLYHIKHKSNPNLGIRLTGWTSVKEALHEKTEGILISHLRANHKMLVEEYDIKHLSEMYSQVFLGDLHFRYSPYDNVHYTSSPYSTKFTDGSLKDYGYILLETQDNSWKYVDLKLPCKVKRTCEFKDIEKTIKGLDKHLIKLEVKGTLEELKTLPELSNVIYYKVAQEISAVQIQNQPKTDALDTLSSYVIASDFLTRYPNTEIRIEEVIKDLKGNL